MTINPRDMFEHETSPIQRSPVVHATPPLEHAGHALAQTLGRFDRDTLDALRVKNC
ncbi:MAG: hypothetical protein FWD57_03060 [Polyangiaceae bacterium]|nr:hypothetical protein [Polyangiaceae bacterium]